VASPEQAYLCGPSRYCRFVKIFRSDGAKGRIGIKNLKKKKISKNRKKFQSCAPLPRQGFVFACACALVFVLLVLSVVRACVCVCVDCICFIVIVRVCARFAASSCQCEIFEKYPSLLVPPPVAAVRDFEFRAFGFRISFFFFCDRRSRARLRWNFRSFGAFPSLVRSHYLKFCSVCLSTECRRWPEWSEHVKYFNNNNKYHALRAGVNNRQVGHRASAKKFLLFTERDILRCVYRSAKRSVYTNFMFAFFWTDKMVPGWLGLIDDQLPIAGVSCDVSITWRTAPVDYFICRSYIILSSNLFYRFTV